MANYKAMYAKTFNAITDAERQLQQVAELLRITQQECEEMFIEGDILASESTACLDKLMNEKRHSRAYTLLEPEDW
ncbi:hypothetical protein LJC63_01185 [Ruminococcaceae bacterium OttesenSCG-928-L11]|nr:hypothetical protein [Ruminococcaceae bacterium OttesenSCG-928-L11]